MSSKHLPGDVNLAWPSAEIAVMGPKGAAEIIFKKEIANAEDPEVMLAEKEKEYRDKFANPYLAAERGYIDEVILPRNTRLRIIQALRMLENKVDKNPVKKHGNIPL
jgi:propionyl-CoA carboxylase beta subunit